MAVAYLGLGTNLGEKEQNLQKAVQKIEKQIGKVISLSAFYVTEPWGFTSENSFLNAALGTETTLSPMELLSATQSIEKEMGRTVKSAHGSYSDRIIDIDILVYENLILQSDILILPHPLLQERLFVLEPLAEIAPDIIHPVYKKTLSTLLKQLKG